jgi:lipopolysaccharide transport system permease protein
LVAPTIKGLAIETESAHPSRPPLPDKPLVVIEPRKSWGSINLRDLWAYRELFYFLIWRDLKVRYKQTVLGVVWVVIQPLAATLVFTIFLGVLARVPSDGAPYALLVYTGLLPWTFFSTAVAGSSNSLVGNTHLITKVYFPRMIIPGAAIGGRLLDFGIALAILAPLMIYYRVAPTGNLLALPLLVALITVFSWGVGMWSSALNVKYRDVGVILPVLTQLWMFVSPVAYPVSLVPEKWRWLYFLNPMAGIVEGFRAAILGGPFRWGAIAYSTAATLIIFFYSAYVFRRMERSFADII